MQRELRIVLLTSSGLRHRFVAGQLARFVNLVGVVSEAGSAGATAAGATPEYSLPADQSVITEHFVERDAVERRMLGTMNAFPDTEILELPHGGANAPETLTWIQGKNPDLVVLYGSSIIKPPLLDVYEKGMVNLHLGLSPYYRGSGTNFWPLVNREPECVGATIHLAVQSVDAGALLAQVRPEPEISDRAHELGTKTIMAAVAIMPRVLSLYATGGIQPQSQDLTQGRVYRKRDFNADAVRAMWHNLKTGMMAEYLADAAQRCRRYPIQELDALQQPDDVQTVADNSHGERPGESSISSVAAQEYSP